LFTTALCILLGVLLHWPPAQAETTYGPWKSAPIHGGGYLQQVFFAPSDSRRMYMTSDVGGLFRSDDKGQTWRMLHGALPADSSSYSPRGFTVHPKDADRIMIGAGNAWGGPGGVWLSSDGGATWKRTLQVRFEGNGWYRSAGNVLVLSPHNPDVVLAGPVGGGIWRSTNGGLSWVKTGPEDINPTQIYFDRANAQRVWVCAQPWDEVKVKRADGSEVGVRGGLFFSEDAGRTWNQIADKGPSEICQDPSDASVMYGVMGSQRIVRSTDRGRTWENFSQGLAPYNNGDARTDGSYDALAVGPNFVLAGGNGGHIYRLSDDKTMWREIKPDTINEGDWWGRIKPNSYRHFGSALGFVGINPRDPSHWVFTDWYALYQSLDAGKTWNLTLNGVEMTVLNTVAQEPTNPNVFHTGMADVGYFRSPDSGKTMQWITNGISNNIKTIFPSMAQPGRLYATGPREWQWHANEMFISDDAGLSWRRSGLNGIPKMEERRCETVVAHPTKKDDVWVTISGPIKPGEGGPWHSVDGGKTWKWEGTGLPEVDQFFRSGYWVSGPELAISADGSLVATSDDRRLLARRGPNDDKWTMLDLPGGAPNCVTADPLQAGRFYLALQDGGLWRSDDSGKSWKNIVDRDIHWVTPDLKVRGRVAAVAPWGVLVSTDSGATWRDMSRALPYRHSRNVVCFAGEQVVVGTGGNGVFYAPLSSLQGAATSRARSTARATADAAPAGLIQNAAMTAGTTTPSSWNLADWKEGTLSLKRDTAVYASAPAALLLETQGKATGMVHQSLQPTPKGPVTIEGKIKTSGNFDNVQIALQVFDAQWKQIDWKVVATGPQTTSGWQTFKGTQTVRDDAAYALLGLSVNGTGKVWLDDVFATTTGGTIAVPQQETAVDAVALPVAVAANDPLIRYTGRFDWSTRAAPRVAWPASTIALRFRGTDLNVKFQDSPSNRWQVEVDGVPTTTLQMTEGEHTYRVAAGLTNGEHTVRLVKATEALFGTAQVHGFELNQGGRLLPLPAAIRHIEVIGDSISAGYGNEAASKEEKFSHKTENAYFTYGAMAARELGADYTCIAWSGKKMWPDNTIPELYDRALPNEANSQWNFAQQVPNAVLINLATNDFAGGIPDEAGWTGAYKAFIARVRRNYPQAHIYCAIGPMMGDWGNGKPLTTLRNYLSKTVNDVRAAGDAKVHLIDFGTQDAQNGFGADWHPNIKTNQLMAAQLVQTLRKDLKW
jgi:photosystem II stability/assembly factor-like uncharacterized protein